MADDFDFDVSLDQFGGGGPAMERIAAVLDAAGIESRIPCVYGDLKITVGLHGAARSIRVETTDRRLSQRAALIYALGALVRELMPEAQQ